MTSFPWILVVLAALCAWMPKWTRSDLYFGVTVAPAFVDTAEARRIRRRYRLEVALLLLAALALAAIWATGAGFAVLLLGDCWAVARAHRATLAYATPPSARREASLSPVRDLPGGELLLWGPVLFVAAAGLYAWLRWDELPARIPVDWEITRAERWIDRTPAGVAAFLGIAGLICALHAVAAQGILHRSRRIAASGSGAGGESLFRRVSAGLALLLPYLIVIPVVVAAFAPEAPAPWFWAVLYIGAIVVGIGTLLTIGQGGQRLAEPIAEAAPIGDRTPDAAWKWGLLYYNPDDPALVVEKRFGIGYTVNWANPWSWPLLGLTLAPIVLLLILVPPG